MNFHEQTMGAVTVIKPDGPLLGEDADQFRKRILELLASSMGRCVVDASAVAFVDSRGLEALADANEEIARSGHAQGLGVPNAVYCGGEPLKLCGVTETVRQVLELTELSPRFEFFEDVNAAVRSFL
jgi:anti-anti-sigma factor